MAKQDLHLTRNIGIMAHIDAGKSWTLITNRVVHSSVKKICTVWLKLTVHLLTLDSNQVLINL